MKTFLTLGLVISSAVFSSEVANAAQLQAIRAMSAPRMNTLLQDARKLINRNGPAGDCSRVGAWKIVSRRTTESNQATAKQLIHKLNLLTGDEQSVADRVRSPNADRLALEMITIQGLSPIEDRNDPAQAKRLVRALADALSPVVRQVGVEFYEGVHSDEDGTWSITTLVDDRKGEILIMVAGYCGT
jgi:hypothetical protein